ncbi:MAG: hypothetical protein AAGM22_30255 [Acidobacteriota bacterium]
MILVLSLLLLGQADACPRDQYLAKFTACADPRLCDLAPLDLPEREPKELTRWGEDCHLYALMPSGWDHRTPARGLVNVGRLFPAYALNWDGADGQPYGASQALAEGELGHTVLAIAFQSELWGCGERNTSLFDVAALEAAGVCVESTGAPVANPWWRLPKTGSSVATHSLLKRCDGEVSKSIFFGLEADANGLEDAEWQASGVIADQVLERLRGVEGYELVCVTDAMAAERRRALLQR